MIKNFSQYLIEEQREVFFTFGRMNPPTIGHGKVMDVLAAKSGKADYKVFISQTQDKKKNPLSYNDKVKHARKMFTKHARNIIVNKKVKTPIDALVALYDQGYKNVTMVVGSDRVTSFSTLFDQYNGVKARHGFYNFQSLKVVSAGERDPDADGVEGMSASKQRDNAKQNDFVSFSQGVPKAMSNSDARKLFNDVRTGMGLKEETEFKNHISFQPVSETREKFVQGELYNVGDMVVVKESGNLTEVTRLGANYVITETNGIQTRRWLDSVEKLLEPVEQPVQESTVQQQFDKTGTITFKDMIEQGGAGDEGTTKLKKKYEKDTPHMKIDERSWSHDFGRIASKTIKKDMYNKLANRAIDMMTADGRHGPEYYAAQVIRKFNIKGVNAKALADTIKQIKKGK